METLTVECLRCGSSRSMRGRDHRADAGECPRCGYLGWAPSTDLTESARRRIREQPLDRRAVGLHAV